jgi:hypothetical protein
MPKFAVIDGSLVINSILADSLEIAEAVSGQRCIASEVAGTGWVYDEELNEFVEPEQVQAEVIPQEPLVPQATLEPLPITE